MKSAGIIKCFNAVIEYGLLAIVFLVPIIFDFSGLTYNVVDIYKAAAFRVILTLVLLAYIGKIFLAGKLSYRGSNKIFIFVALLALSFFISSLYSIHPNQSFWGDFFRQQGFYSFIHYLLFFSLIILNLHSFKQINRIIVAMVVSASLASFYGLIQYLNLDPVSWLENATEISRVFSTLGQPNWFGHFLILALPFSLYALFFLAKSFLARFFVILSILMQLLCLLFSYSRAAWLAFFFSMTTLLLVWLIIKGYKKVVLGFMVFFLIGAILIIGLNIKKPSNQRTDSPFFARMNSIANLSADGSSRMRLNYIRASIQEIRQAEPARLFFGYGPEALSGIFMRYYQPDWAIYETINGSPDRAHNWFFDQILSLGVLGLAATMIFYAYFLYKAFRFFFLRRMIDDHAWLLLFLFASLASYFINNLFSFSLLTNQVYLFLILAIAWLIINFEEKEKITDLRLTAFSKLLIWFSLFAVAAVFIYTNNINQVRAEIYYVRAVKAMNVPDCRKVIANMETVIRLSPNNSYYQENFLFMSANCLPLISNNSAKIELLEAIVSMLGTIGDKELSELQINLARFNAVLGYNLDKAYYKEAERIFSKLIYQYPNFTQAYEDFGRMKIWQEDYRGAIRLFEKAIAVLPPLDHPGLNQRHRKSSEAIAVRLFEEIGQAYLKIKDYQQADAYFKKGLRLNPYRATLYKNLADVNYLQGDIDQAIKFNQRGFMLNPGDYSWPLSLSLLYRDKKDLPAAENYLNQAMKLAPENGELKNYYQELNKK